MYVQWWYLCLHNRVQEHNDFMTLYHSYDYDCISLVLHDHLEVIHS